MPSFIAADRYSHYRPHVAAAFAASLMLGIAINGAASAASLKDIEAAGHVAIATEDDFRPFEFVKDGTPTGFDNELLAAFRKFAKFEVRQDIIPFTGLIPGVVSGKYDAAWTALLITKERQQALDFTLPIAEATIYYAKRKGDDRIKSVADLNGRKVGVQAGSAMFQRLPELEKLLAQTGGKLGEVAKYTSNPDAYQDLALGRVDYVVNNIIGLKSLVAEKGDVFEIGQPVSSKTYIAFAVKKGNDDLREYLNSFIAAERKNGDIEALQKKWFGISFPDLPDSFVSEY
jgi:polar amino acid transport system substrate-binding protein